MRYEGIATFFIYPGMGANADKIPLAVVLVGLILVALQIPTYIGQDIQIKGPGGV